MPKTSEEVLDARRSLNVGDLAAGCVGVEVAALGKKGLQYSEAKSSAKAKVDKALVTQAKPVLKALFETLGARHITKAQLLELVCEVRRNNTELIKVKDTHADQWDEVMACRYRNLLHHANGYAKGPEKQRPIPGWFRSLGLAGIPDHTDGADAGEEKDDKCEGEDEDEDEEEDDDEVCKKPAGKDDTPDQVWLYGWNDELQVPDRRK